VETGSGGLQCEGHSFPFPSSQRQNRTALRLAPGPADSNLRPGRCDRYWTRPKGS